MLTSRRSARRHRIEISEEPCGGLVVNFADREPERGVEQPFDGDLKSKPSA
jgi:hypothetical protein